MSFTIKTRYGHMEEFANDASVPAIVERLIQELETEKFDEPDDEHTQIAISHGDWSVTVQVSGLMTLDDLSGITGSDDDVPGEALHIRARARAEAVGMLTKMARGEIDSVRAEPWVPHEKVPPYKQDLFRV